MTKREKQYARGVRIGGAVWTAALVLTAGAVLPTVLLAQEHEEVAAEAEHHEATPRHRLAIFTGNTWVRQAEEDHVLGAIAAPTIGIDYAFRFAEGWAIGVISDFQLDSYVVEREDGSELERERLFVTSAVLMWEPFRPVYFFVGPGVETDVHETLGLIKVGFEWELFAPHPWDVALNAAWDLKDGYDAIAIGLSIGRLFG